jgi:cytochrome c553
MRVSLTWLLAAVVMGACGGDDAPGDIDAPIDATDLPIDAPAPDGPWVEPTMLSQTGLYANIVDGTIAPGVIEYAPRWHLWSDAAVKRRWIWLPPGTQIDSTDMDYWSMPVGTKFWKEFTRGGDRIETRLLEKIAPGDDVTSWFMVAFEWNESQTDAVAVPGGVVDDPGPNDIPARSACRQCHGPNRNKAVILGFQALQLDYQAPQDGMDLGKLIEDDLLTLPVGLPVGSSSYFPLPAGDTTRDAVGYLHANCGGCHNADSDVQNTVELELRLSTAAGELATWEATDTYRTAVNVAAMLPNNGTHVVKGMDTANSAVFLRMQSVVGGVRMPPIARETVDDEAVTAVQAWINSLPPPP